ncbi:MAG: hypothetical protein JW750_12625 [Anaerolineaceae bacterium]|nr:hypothetical protein [Anaerolineaceae bacterium]
MRVPSEQEEIHENLWNKDVTPENYGSDRSLFYQHVMEQYKICLEMADRISSRRATANAFFLTLHSLIIGTFGVVVEQGWEIHSRLLIILITILLLFLCFAWGWLIRSYRQLNTAKFKVIGALEQKLPGRPFVSAEWKALGEGNDPSKYVPLTKVEVWIPWVFAAFYLSTAVFLFVTISTSGSAS